MIILFTKDNSFISKSIRKTTGEKISHVALFLYPDKVIHSTTSGLKIEEAKTFFLSNTIIDSFLYKDASINIKELANNLEEKYKNISYDFPAMAFLFFSILGNRIFGIPMPKKNLWQISSMFLCTEFVTEIIEEAADSMITPGELMEKISKSDKWKRIPLCKLWYNVFMSSSV